jgi:hypothetical protein
MEFKITETNRGNKCLISEDFRYRFHKTLKNGKVSWRCSNKSCKATLKTVGENLMVVETNGEHCHESDKRKCERQQLRVSVKLKAVEDVTSRPTKLIRTELQSSDNQNIQTGDLKLPQLAIYRERRRELPPLPTFRDEVHDAIDKMDIKTNKEEPFVLHNDRETGIIIFSCTSNLRCLCNEVQEIFIDGSFKCCSKYFLQIYNIHGLKNEHYVPLVFTLLSELVYRKMWTSVASLCKGLDLILSPETIHIDFEVAMHNVLRDIFTNSRILCCRFHLSQAWWRKIQVL